MSVTLSLDRIVAASQQGEAELVRVALKKRLQKKRQKQQEQGGTPKQVRQKARQQQSQADKAKHIKPGAPDKKRPGRKPKPDSKKALREKELAKVPQERDKGIKYCLQQTGQGGHPKLWVRPSERRRAFCRSLGPKEIRRLRKKLRNKAKGKGQAPRSLRQLLQVMKGVRADTAAGETMGDAAIRRRMRRQLGRLLEHGGMSRERLEQVAKGKPQAINAFKKMISGRGMGQFGMQDLTDTKKLAEHFNDFVETADAYGVKEALKSQRHQNIQSNTAFRASKGKTGDGFDALRAKNAEKRKGRRQQGKEDESALAQSEEPLDYYGGGYEDEGERADEWMADQGYTYDDEPAAEPEEEMTPRRRAEIEESRRRAKELGVRSAADRRVVAAAQKYNRSVFAGSVDDKSEWYGDENPLLASGDWDIIRGYAMARATYHANLDRIAAKAALLV